MELKSGVYVLTLKLARHVHSLPTMEADSRILEFSISFHSFGRAASSFGITHTTSDNTSSRK